MCRRRKEHAPCAGAGDARRVSMDGRGYQHGFSDACPAMQDVAGRERKAHTMVAVLRDHFGLPLEGLSLLNVGGSMGVIDNVLAQHFASVVSVDIDAPAIEHAQRNYRRANLVFELGDAMALGHPDASFDVVVCSQVYE